MGAAHLDAGLAECLPQQAEQAVPLVTGRGQGMSRLLEDFG